MPDHLKYKMYDLEVAPPATAWESIAAALADAEQYANLSGKMYNHAETPAPDLWNSIAERLDDDTSFSQLSDNLKNFETPPPTHSWQNIAAALDNVAEEKDQARVIPFKRLFYRIAAAAVFAGLLIGGWVYLNPSTKQIETAATISKPAPANTLNNPGETQLPTTNPAQVAPSIETGAADVGAIFSQKQHSTENTIAHPLTASVVAKPTNASDFAINVDAPQIKNEKGEVIHDIEQLTSNSNYVIVTGPNGQLTRMSAKFANLIRYMNDADDNTEEYVDKVIKESSIWKKRFQEWRSKISQSSFIPSTTNFLDIMEFKELIQEMP